MAVKNYAAEFSAESNDPRFNVAFATIDNDLPRSRPSPAADSDADKARAQRIEGGGSVPARCRCIVRQGWCWKQRATRQQCYRPTDKAGFAYYRAIPLTM